jgi:hypothetical protein
MCINLNPKYCIRVEGGKGGKEERGEKNENRSRARKAIGDGYTHSTRKRESSEDEAEANAL